MDRRRERADPDRGNEEADSLQVVRDALRGAQDDDQEQAGRDPDDGADPEFLREADEPAADPRGVRADVREDGHHQRDPDGVVEAGLRLEDRPRARLAAAAPTEDGVHRRGVGRRERDTDERGDRPVEPEGVVPDRRQSRGGGGRARQGKDERRRHVRLERAHARRDPPLEEDREERDGRDLLEVKRPQVVRRNQVGRPGDDPDAEERRRARQADASGERRGGDRDQEQDGEREEVGEEVGVGVHVSLRPARRRAAMLRRRSTRCRVRA